MTQLFEKLSLYDGVPPASFDAVLATYQPHAAPRGTWPTELGSAAQTGRTSEPLVSDTWQLVWQTGLGPAREPKSILIGNDLLVVNGAEGRGIWRSNEQTAFIPAGHGACFLDLDGARMWSDDLGAGLCTHTFDGTKDASVLLAFPQGYMTQQILEGPGVLVFVSVPSSRFAPSKEAVIEALRVRDYQRKSALGILYGLEPLGGIIRTADAYVLAAASMTGPVFATTSGLRWCSWQLQSLHDQAFEGVPRALSMDDAGRACLVYEKEGAARFAVLPPTGPAVFDVELPWKAGVPTQPALSAGREIIFLVAAGHLMALASDGRVLWHRQRPSAAPATLTSNGFLLVVDEDVTAISADGVRHALFRPPAPPRTAPILANGMIHVATSDALLVLRS